jgi:hypothetical protein
MKRITFLLLLVLAVLAISSCKKKETSNPSVDAFVGNWSVVDSSFYNGVFTGSALKYYVVIKKDDAKSDGIIITGLGNSPGDYHVTLSGDLGTFEDNPNYTSIIRKGNRFRVLGGFMYVETPSSGPEFTVTGSK